MTTRLRCVSRRSLLGASALSSLGWLLTPSSSRADSAPVLAPVPAVPVLLCVFLRGAADGLNVVVPHADADYYRLRPTIAVPQPGQKGGAIDLDGRFGLHPRLAALKPSYDAGELAIVHAVGSPHPTRSHFEAQDYMETGAVGESSAARGWLARYFEQKPESAAGAGALRAVALSGRSPLALRGYRNAVVAPSLKDFRLGGGKALEPTLTHGFERLYRATAPELAERAGQYALASSALVARALRQQRTPAGAGYGRDGQEFADVARLIKADVGLETAWIDVGGWDTHRAEGSAENGELPRQLERLGRSLAAFRSDLGPAFERVVVVVMSEFGRTARENGTGGTDHGHGGAMLVLGGNVNGGRVLGSFAGLAPDQLHEGRDLPVTTDFRDLLAEVSERHLGLTDAGPLFPGFQLQRERRLGLLR
jgi:uncharacterized protein (DUF1501 family)